MPDETRKSTKSIGVCIWTVWWDTDTVLQKSYAVIVFEGGGIWHACRIHLSEIYM